MAGAMPVSAWPWHCAQAGMPRPASPSNTSALPRARLCADASLRVETGDPDADDLATRALLAAVNASGRAFVTHTVVGGRYAIRVAVGGVTTGRADLDALWELLRPHPV